MTNEPRDDTVVTAASESVALGALYETDTADIGPIDDHDSHDPAADSVRATDSEEPGGRTEMVGGLTRTEYEAIIASAAVW